MEKQGWIEGVLWSLGQGLWERFPWLGLIMPVLCILAIVCLSALILIWLERKISGDIQSRIGPIHHGPYGLLQTVWDALKLLQKEDMVPRAADKIVFCVAPFIAFVPAVLLYVVIPFGKSWEAADLNVGVFYVLAVGSIGVIGLIVGGWASNNKWSLLGGMRAAVQLISYEIPGFLALVAIIMISSTLSLTTIVEKQAERAWVEWLPFTGWYCFTLPGLIAAVLYLIAALAEVNRQPFDLPEAESELVSGFNTEYSGFRFAMFFLGEFSNNLIVASVATTLFFGGWASPLGNAYPTAVGFLGDGIHWFFLKAGLLILGLMWVKWTLPRVRIDQMLLVAWKGLIPIAVVNLVIAAGYVVFVGVGS